MSRSPIVTAVHDAIVATRAGSRPFPIDPDCLLEEDLGLDSLDTVKVVTLAEGQLGLHYSGMSRTDTPQFRRVADLVTYFERRLADAGAVTKEE